MILRSTRIVPILLAMTLLAGCGRGTPSSGPELPSSSSEGASSSAGSSAAPSSFIPELVPADPRPGLADKLRAGIARNSDTVGWIAIPGTTVDDAVMQAKDNSYYLRLTEDKKYDIFGSYFMDYESKQGTRAELSRNNIIYGHSDLRDNKDGPKFSQLFKYTEINFMEEHPYIYYATRQEAMVWQIFSVFYTHVNFDYIQADPTDARFSEVINEAKLRSQYILDVPVTGSDKILTLSTCTVNYNPTDPDNYRLVVMAKLLPADAKLKKSVEVRGNPTPKRS